MEEYIKKAGVLLEALPYIQQFASKTFVIKFGGSIASDNDLKEGFIKDIILLKLVGINIIIVHGGGKDIDNLLKKLGMKINFHDGYRLTDESTMEVVEMVLSGKINKELVALINKFGGKACGLSGKDGNLIVAEKIKMGKIDLGNVGAVKRVNKEILLTLDASFIPVIAPVSMDEAGNTLNINADLAAGAIAAELAAEKLIILSDQDGLLDSKNELISSAKENEIKKMIKDGVIYGGMIPKANSCISALNLGVKNVHIINGSIPHAVLIEIFTKKGIGTQITH
ncbi:MAG: acetylglutamate kinase [Deltaproteobacteria bacterium]|jgi:acetylglutamate kinase|nr:acetylglutamate kinase [Deltaproteobacteria bacterium]MCL5880669.1 acetylglutamate kinase [Deltaproteobacteria bacterium]MDA8305180.1 acetylglutamate kinase [Deltaproteobacteria bacterium]